MAPDQKAILPIEKKASRVFKFAYCIALFGFIFPFGFYASSGWMGLMSGGGIFRAGLIVPDILLLLIGCRIAFVIFNPSALDVYVAGRLVQGARSLGAFLIYVGVLAMLGMFLIKPIALAIFKSPGEGGIAFFVVGTYLLFIAVLAIPGFIIFELSRLGSSRSQRKSIIDTGSSAVASTASSSHGYSRNLRRAIVAVFLCWLALNAVAPYFLNRQADVARLRQKEFVTRLDEAFHDRSIPAQNVTLEVLEENIIRPARIFENATSSDASDWKKESLDTDGIALCQTLLKRSPSENGWMNFAQDSMGKRKAKDSGGAICRQDAIWFKDYALDRGRTALTKYTPAGDLAYRLSFANPSAAEAESEPGYVMERTFRSENGYLYFEWWNSGYHGTTVRVTRIVKARVKEPISGQAMPVDKR